MYIHAKNTQRSAQLFRQLISYVLSLGLEDQGKHFNISSIKRNS